jgi:hypothetical protein
MSEVGANEVLTSCPQCRGDVIIIPGVYFPAQLVCSQCGLDLRAWFDPDRPLLERARRLHVKLRKTIEKSMLHRPNGAIGNVIFYINANGDTDMGGNCPEIPPPSSTDSRFLTPLRDFSGQPRPDVSEPPSSAAPDPSDVEGAEALGRRSVIPVSRLSSFDRLPGNLKAVRSSLPDLPAPFTLLRPEQVKKLMIGDQAGEESAIWKNNKECPFCGMPANPKIKACETGLSYCSDRCATLHVKSVTPEGGW